MLEPKIKGTSVVVCIWIFCVLHLPKPSEMLLAGGFDALIKANPQLESQAYNEILKCPNCGKPCAGAPFVLEHNHGPCGIGIISYD